MREQELRFQSEDGALPFRQHTEEGGKGSCSYPATDGMFGTILGVYREYLVSADGRWLARQWPKIVKAMDFCLATWDSDHDGVLSGQQHNTLDGKLGGSTSWLGSLYLAALRAMERMAIEMDDKERAEYYAAIAAKGSAKQATTLFNGEYYQQKLDSNKANWYRDHGHMNPKELAPALVDGMNYDNGCLTDQLLGQWWADQLNLGAIYPRGDEKIALANLFKNNFILKFSEKDSPLWTSADQPGMVACTWPKGIAPEFKGKKMIGYSGCVLAGLEYAAAAAMIRAGLLKEGFTVVKAVSDRYDGRLKSPFHKSAWGYGGNPFGDDESGKYYARSQSAWSLLLAGQGFIYDGPLARIGFKPVWQPDDHFLQVFPQKNPFRRAF